MGAVVFTKVKVKKSMDPSGPWTFWVLGACKDYHYCALVEIGYYIFFVFCQNYQIGQQSFKDPLLGHWARLYVLNFECKT